MEINEFVTSGIIEAYCLGIASESEKKQVETLASENEEVRQEIASVNEALQQYALASAKTPAVSIKDKIMQAINEIEKTIQFPPRLTLNSTTSEWQKYISDNKIFSPPSFDPVHWVDLPSDEKQTTYTVWARKGAAMEESHESEDEYLIMLKGSCAVTINGKTGYYKEGSVIYIPKNSFHRAEALSDDMHLVGQRIAA